MWPSLKKKTRDACDISFLVLQDRPEFRTVSVGKGITTLSFRMVWTVRHALLVGNVLVSHEQRCISVAWHGTAISFFASCLICKKKNLFFTVPLLCWFQVAMLQYQSKRDIGLTILLYMRWPPIMFFQFSNATLLWHVPAILTWRALKAGEGSYAPCVDTITQKQMWKKSTFYSLEDASTACEYSLMRFMLLAETTDSFIYGQYQHWADRSVSHMHPWQTKGWCEWWLPSYEITYMPLCTLPLMQVSVSKFIHFY